MNSVPKEERDPNLAKKLWKERDAIVTKALQYARKLMKQGLQDGAGRSIKEDV